MPAESPVSGSVWKRVARPTWNTARGEEIIGGVVGPVVGALVLVAAWAVVAVRFDVTVFPSPGEALSESWRLMADGALVAHAGVSVSRLAVGFAIGAALAIPVGFAMGLFPFCRRMLEPFTEFFRFVPAIAMVVFALIWFGIGEPSKIFLIAYNAFFSVALATELGVAHVERNRINAMRCLGGSRSDVFRFVVIPSVVPYTLQGMRIGMGRAFGTIVSAEILAANNGLGYLIYSAREFSKMDTVVVAIVTLGLLGIVADRLFVLTAWFTARQYLPSGVESD